MFRYLLVVSSCLLFSIGRSQAAPATLSVKTTGIDALPGWEVERYYIPDEGVREGEVVISMSMDVDGDGVPERLVTTNFQRNGKMGNMWTVYDVADGRIREIGDLQFDADLCGVFVEREFSPVPRLYSFGKEGRSLNLITYSLSGGKLVTETAKKGVDFDEYAGIMKKSPPDIRTRDAAEVYNLYTREYVNRLTMTEAESRAIKERIKNHTVPSRPSKADAEQLSADRSSVTGGGIPGWVFYAFVAFFLIVPTISRYLRRKSA